MSPFVRRSHLIVEVLDGDAVESSWTHNADSVILTMPQGSNRSLARMKLGDAVRAAGMGGAEVFRVCGQGYRVR